MSKYSDGEVLGIDTDKNLIMWNAIKKERYYSGESLEHYGEHNLLPKEIKRLRKQGVKIPYTIQGD